MEANIDFGKPHKLSKNKPQIQAGNTILHTVVVNFEDEMKPGPQDALVPNDFDEELQHLFFSEINSPHSLLDKMEALVNRTIRLNNSRIHGKKMEWTRNYTIVCRKNDGANFFENNIPNVSRQIIQNFHSNGTQHDNNHILKVDSIGISILPMKWPCELGMEDNL